MKKKWISLIREFSFLNRYPCVLMLVEKLTVFKELTVLKRCNTYVINGRVLLYKTLVKVKYTK